MSRNVSLVIASRRLSANTTVGLKNKKKQKKVGILDVWALAFEKTLHVPSNIQLWVMKTLSRETILSKVFLPFSVLRTFSGDANLIKLFCIPSEKGSTLLLE